MHLLDEMPGLFKLDRMACSFCGRPATLLTTGPRDSEQVLAWGCQEHMSALAKASEPIWAFPRICQSEEGHGRCDARAEWLEIVATDSMSLPVSRCAHHSVPA